MRLFTLLLSITVTGFNSLASAEALKEKWEGYKPVASADLPQKVKEFAENAVFLMESVESLPGEKMDIIDLQNDPRAKTKVTDKTVLKEDIVAFQIETCRKQKLRYCPIASTRILGTVFFNNNKFYTCRHGFHNWLSAAAEANNMLVSDISPPMVLRIPNKDKPGRFKVVYQSSFENDPMLNFSFINDNPILNVPIDRGTSQWGSSNASKTDFVEMNLSNGKSKAIVDYNLPVKNLSSREKDVEIYTFGYPGKTQHPALGENNGPGSNQLSVSHGFVKGYYKIKSLFFSSNFASPGMSGGPVVTADGNIVGMACVGESYEKADTEPGEVGTLFFPLDKNKLEDFWISAGLSYADQSESTQTSN